MEIQKLAIDKVFPNDWNPNHLKPAHYEKLKRFVQKEGAVLPIVVRPYPSKKGAFQIIDGFHRWLIAKELGQPDIEAVVVDVPDDRAKILTVNLNYLRGQPKPREYAELLHGLTELHSLDDLALMLPDDKPALLDRLELLRLPDDFDAEIRAKAEEADREKLSTISFQVTDEQKALIESALETVDRKKKGSALAELVKAGAGVITQSSDLTDS